MADETIKEIAEQSVKDTLEAGQSIQQGDMNTSRASLKDAHAVAIDEEGRSARKTGRRPLFRNLNISGME